MEPEKPTPDIVAAVDQAGAGFGTIARLLGGYMESLLGAGFERDEAMDLIRDWHREWVENLSWPDA